MTGCIEHNQKGYRYGSTKTLINGVKKNTGMHRVAYCKAKGVTHESTIGLVVRHKCDNKRCINPDHLEIGTSVDNAQDAIERGRRAPTRCELNPNARLTPEDVAYIRQSSAPASALAERFQVTSVHIYRIRAGKQYVT